MEVKSLLIFLLGFFSCAFLFCSINYSGVEVPFGTGLASFDMRAPSDWVGEDDIVIFEDRVVLRIANVTISSYADSGSMKPVFDEGANGIRVVPGSEDEIEVGDIVSYRYVASRGIPSVWWASADTDKEDKILVVHRVVEKGFDNEGVYFVMKGDNNLVGDGKVRFEDIEYVTVGVIF